MVSLSVSHHSSPIQDSQGAEPQVKIVSPPVEGAVDTRCWNALMLYKVYSDDYPYYRPKVFDLVYACLSWKLQ